MTISDARKRTEPSCPGVDRCDRLKPFMDQEYSIQAAEEITKTCRECGKYRMQK